jgi:hypothetical protein
VVTSNSSPDSFVRQASDNLSPSARKETYERGLATIPLPTLSRRVHAPVICQQQSGKRRVISAIWIRPVSLGTGCVHAPERALALSARRSIGSGSVRLIRYADQGLSSWCDHEQRITSHLNLSSDQCRYDDRMRVRGDFRIFAEL